MQRVREMSFKVLANLGIGRVEELIRYYGIGVINTIFGFGLYSVLIFVGLNLYIAQIIAHVIGTTFNYFTYSRHVFQRSQRKPMSYVVAYVFNYLLGLCLLAGSHHFFRSPYLAGFIALIIGTAINFFVLKRFVFPARRQPA
jgi:putative flippase GtrA